MLGLRFPVSYSFAVYYIDTMNCPAGSYEALNDLMAAIQKGEYLDKIGLTAAHVAECDSVDQVQLFGVSTAKTIDLTC